MKRVARAVTKKAYTRAVKPLLFKYTTPDQAHENIMKYGGIYQKIPLVRHAGRIMAYSNTDYLRQEIAGVAFDNPVGVSAGFDKNIELPQVLKSIGFGFMTGGSVTAQACDGNPRPWFHRLPEAQSLLVHAGLPNQGVQAVLNRVKHYAPRTFARFPLIVSIAKTNSKQVACDTEAIDDYLASFRAFEATQKHAMYELNISCPNTYGGEPFTTPERLDGLLGRIDELGLTRPLTIKMPLDLAWPEFDALLAVIVRHNVQGVTIANLAKDRSKVHITGLTDDMKGNMSGAPTRERSTELIAKTYQKYGKTLFIIGVGGVFTAHDAYQKIRAGASMVALITGLIYEGPQIAGHINRELVTLLKKDGFSHISEAIGIDTAHR